MKKAFQCICHGEAPKENARRKPVEALNLGEPLKINTQQLDLPSLDLMLMQKAAQAKLEQLLSPSVAFRPPPGLAPPDMEPLGPT